MEFEKIKGLITDKEISQLADQYAKNNREKNDLGFNIFNIISDTFYRENFHSDILKALFEINSFRIGFIELLNNLNHDLNISSSDYNNCVVEREKGRIDILISDKETKKAIIIENKINNAQDTYKQLPRYAEFVKQEDFTLEAIVYLSLDGGKVPDEMDWTEKEKEDIDKILVNLPAYNEKNNDLFSLLQKVETQISNIDKLLLFRQYKQLIKYLGRNNMNKPILEKLYQFLKEEEKFQTIETLVNMFNDLPEYRATRIRDKFQDSTKPFEKIDVWGNRIAYFDNFKTNGSNFKLQIDCTYTNKYEVCFLDKNSEDNKTALDFIKKIGIEELKKEENDRKICKIFQFPNQEEELYNFIKKILETIREYQQKE